MTPTVWRGRDLGRIWRMDLIVEVYAGPRAEVRPLFDLAEDSVVQLDGCAGTRR
jgi:hypothetical protein